MSKLEVVTIDFESFWSVDHSLTKMNPIAYVMHPETEIISVAVKVGKWPTDVVFGEEAVRQALHSIDWSNKMAVAHNMSGFDAMILAWRFGIRPALWGCTLAMAAPHHGITVGGSLAKLVAHYGLGVKDNTALVQTKGKHLKDFTPAEIAAMEEYNKADTEQCAELFKRLFPITSKDELRLIDMTIRMLVEPKFELDTEALEDALVAEKERKRETLLALAHQLGADTDDEETAIQAAQTVLNSAAKFGALLNSLGVETPTKISPRTGKVAPALSKTDEEFLALSEHDNPLVRAAVDARLGTKSTILESRITAFLEAGAAAEGKLPVPLKYFGGHTGRWSGWGYNPQNLNRINPVEPKPSDVLRNSIRAPSGHKIVVCDLSGIELRVNHFLWKVPSSMALYQENPDKADLYKAFASKLYGVDVSAVTKDQRQIGKVCVAEGTLILCKHVSRTFWCPIQYFRPAYQLWDGKEWVWAKGVASNGLKQTQKLCGVSLTPDHLVLCGTTWQAARCVTEGKVAQALATGAENLSLRAILQAYKVASPRLSLRATAGFLNTRLKRTTSSLSKQLGAIFAHANPVRTLASCIGGTPTSCLTMNTASGCSTDYPQRLGDATHPTTATTPTTAVEGYKCAPSGARTDGRFYSTLSHWTGGIYQRLRWTVSTLTGGTSRGTSGSSAAETTCSTSGASKTSKPESLSLRNVYDILNSGPRNRFTVLSDRGPLVVHNCHLGLGFGAGGRTFQKVAKTMGGVTLSEEESQEIVHKWRGEYIEITRGWKKCQAVFRAIQTGVKISIDPWGMCVTDQDTVVLPSGRHLRYPDMREVVDEDRGRSWKFGQGRNEKYMTGGKMDENLVQAIARDVIAEQALEVFKRTGYRPALMVHDELVYVVPDDEADEHLATLNEVMRVPPRWWPELVLSAEGDVATTYGAAK